MTTVFATAAHSPLDGAAARTANWLGSLTAAWNRHWQYRRALAETRALSDRALRDLGMERGTLEQALRAARRGN